MSSTAASGESDPEARLRWVARVDASDAMKVLSPPACRDAGAPRNPVKP